jgi:pimeloyl-ACP methyl ester carboxylesterase
MALVHGSWTDARTWDHVLPALSAGFRVLAYDRRGHSRSERPATPGSVREDAADLAGLLESLGPAPAHVVGNSFGAGVALRLAIDRPELVRSLIVHEPPVFALLEGDPAGEAELAALRERVDAAAGLLRAGRTEDGARAFVDTIALGPGAWEERLSDEGGQCSCSTRPPGSTSWTTPRPTGSPSSASRAAGSGCSSPGASSARRTSREPRSGCGWWCPTPRAGRSPAPPTFRT